MRRLAKRAIKFIPLLAAVLLLLAWPGKGQTSPTFFYVGTAVDGTTGLESVFSNEVQGNYNGPTHTVALTWTASTSGSVSGYNIYRGTKLGGPYAKINPALIAGLSFNDVAVLPNPPALAAASK